MASHIKPQAKLALLVISAAVVIFGLRFAMSTGLIPTPGILKSVVATKVQVLKQEDAVVQGIAPLPFPSSNPANLSSPLFLVDGWEWNAQHSIFGASGGAETMQGSLFEKYNVNYKFKRTDSNDTMRADILACANQMASKNQNTCDTGAAALIFMGDSGGQWLSELNAQLLKLDKGVGAYTVKLYGALGRSNGEDALLGPAEWKKNPQTMLGKTIVGVIRDGDWNIAMAFEGFNNLKNNPDPHTYNPNAVNWMAAPDDDYIKAVTDVYNPHKCEQRPEVDDTGKKDGKIVTVCPDGVVTWTPGDDDAIHGPIEGTTKIISSHEYSAQMPATLAVISKFADKNPDTMSGFFAASFTFADQMKAYPNAIKFASNVAAKVYADNTGDYWYNYFIGSKDKSGNSIGGSAVFNLQDNLQYFGLVPGFQNNMKATYETFARIDMEQYASLFKDSPIPPYSQAVNTKYIRLAEDALTNNGVQGAAAETVNYAAATSTGSVVSKAALYINFANGSAALTPSGKAQLDQLATTLGIAKALAFEIDGYTDNTGKPESNQTLSQQRADAVKAYLQSVAKMDFPDDRFKAVTGKGATGFIAPNDTADNKAKNRRVEILQIGND